MTPPKSVRVLLCDGVPLTLVPPECPQPGDPAFTVLEYRLVQGPATSKGNSKQDYRTPQSLLDHTEDTLGIVLAWDLACTEENRVAGFVAADTRADCPWHVLDGVCWLNPPFGDIKPWVAKCQSESARGAKIVALLPYKPGTKWWREHVAPSAQVISIGRVCFRGETNTLQTDMALALYGDIPYSGPEHWDGEWSKNRKVPEE
jgi:site-specific DNA-methyltransferase (adenine-specific)